MRQFGWVNPLLRLIEGVISGLFAIVVVAELVNLVLRYVFQTGIPEMIEAGSISVVLLCFLGMALGFAEDEHVAFSAIPKKLSQRIGRIAGILSLSLTVCTLAIIAYTGFWTTVKFASLYLRAISMPWLPFWLPMAAIPVGAVLSVLTLCQSIRRGRE